jgi:RNA polymerase sigma-70 factor (ECF subfamily)
MARCNLSQPDPVGLSVDALQNQIVAHVPRLRAFLRKLSGSAQDAEDLLQDTLERSLRYRHSFDRSGSLPGWLMKTAFRCYLDLRDRMPTW